MHRVTRSGEPTRILPRPNSIAQAATPLPHTTQFLHRAEKFTHRETAPCHRRHQTPQRTLPNADVEPSEHEDSIPARKIAWKIDNGTDERRSDDRRTRAARALMRRCARAKSRRAATQLPHAMQFLNPAEKLTRREKGPCHRRGQKSRQTSPHLRVKPSENEKSAPARKITWKIEDGTDESCTGTSRPRAARTLMPRSARVESERMLPNANVRPSENEGSLPARTTVWRTEYDTV